MSSRDDGTAVCVATAPTTTAKITQIKAANLETNVGGILSTAPAIKVAAPGSAATATSAAGGVSTSLTLSTSQATAIRAISAAGQPQVRVVVPTIMPTMLKQYDANGSGRTQITAVPAGQPRTVSNTSITVTRPVTQSAYIPRAGVTAAQMATGQRLVNPIRATPTSSVGGSPVTGLTAGGNFVRGTATTATVSKAAVVASPSTTVISPATSTTWVAANTTGQVQLIRAISHPTRQRIITAQGVTTSSSAPAVVATTSSVASTGAAQSSAQQQTGSAAIQTVASASSVVGSQPHPAQTQQPTYVATLATMLPPRQHQATLLYSPNVPQISQTLNQTQQQQQQQQYNQTVTATAQRFALTTPLSTVAGSSASTPRQIRPIPLAKPFSAAKLNTTSISIRAPNLPQLTPTLGTVSAVSSTAASVATINSARSTTVTAVTGSTASGGAPGAGPAVIPTTNLSTTRIIQLQQPGGGTQQIIGSGRLTGNVMPIIVNASNAGKFGFRPPVTMATKVQPSLTITQLGIGKLAGGTSGGSPVGSSQQQNAAGIQTLGSPSTPPTSLTSTATAQLVNVSQSGASGVGPLTAASAGGATVVPLAINTRGAAGTGGILTGTITPIKSASAITVGKVMAAAAAAIQAQAQTAVEGGGVSAGGNSSGNAVASAAGPAASGGNVYIQQRPQAVSGTATTVTVVNSNGTPTSNSVNTVLTSTGAANAAGYIYYESVPASTVSTGVLSLTTTTVTSSTVSPQIQQQQQQVTSNSGGGNLTISSLPFVTGVHGPASAVAGGNGPSAGATTFTVVPSASGRSIGQLHTIPVSSGASGAAQLQGVPVRFNTQLTNAAGDAIAVSQASAQVVQATISSTGQQILIPAGHQANTSAANATPGQPMVIPLQTSIKVTAGGGSSTGTAVVSNYLRKRDSEGSSIRAAKNLAPTLLSMCTNANSASPNGQAYSGVGGSLLTVDTLAHKDREEMLQHGTRPESPMSTDGSRTVSVNSSPGVEQQIFDNGLLLNRMPNDTMHFNPINEMYPNHHTVVMHHNAMAASEGGGNLVGPGAGCGDTPGSSRTSSIDHQLPSSRHNGGDPFEHPQRKKSRRSTNDSQLSSHSQTSSGAVAPASNAIGSCCADGMDCAHHSLPMPSYEVNPCIGGNSQVKSASNALPTARNKENKKPVEYVLRRPRNCTLLNTYKLNGKAAINHFQRYTDVKPREERRPNIIDLANQANIQSKINGWKIYHLKSQMEDLCENETLNRGTLADMLQEVEAFKNPEMERISDLIKGNIQRSEVIVDGVNEAQNQLMKIFDHKPHVSDIIKRCASKRNFKKREKL